MIQYNYKKRDEMPISFLSKLFPRGVKFWARSSSVVGIDIGSSSIKVVQLRQEKERAVLETYGELSAGSYAGRPIGQVVQLSEGAAVTMLKDILNEAGVTAKNAVVSIPIRNSFVTTIKVPLVATKTMDEVITFEARKYIPIPLNEVEMNWQLLSSGREEEENEPAGVPKRVQLVEVLLVALHKEIIQKYKSIVEQAGLKAEFLEIEIFSLWRSSVFRPTTPVVLVDLGASTTKMSVVDKGLLKSSYTVDRGAREITDTVSKAMNITFERAEEMKRQLGLSARPEYKELSDVMSSVLGIIFGECKQFMLAYRRKHGESVGQVVLTGGGALLKGIVDLAVKELGVEVILADPFGKTDYPPFLQETLREIGPVFASGVGLALRGI